MSTGMSGMSDETSMQDWRGVVIVDTSGDEPFREIDWCQPFWTDLDTRVSLEYRARQESRDGRIREVVAYSTWMEGDQEVVGDTETLRRFLGGEELRD